MYDYYPYWCDECSRGFNSARALEQHNEAVEYFDLFNDTDEEWECEYCDRVCASEQAINQHTRDSHSWECQHCDRVCASEEDINQHKRKHHSWKCRYCDRICASEESINQHTRDCHSQVVVYQTQPQPQHECYTCHQRFHDRGQMFAHIHQQHPTTKKEVVPSVATIAQIVQSAFEGLPPTQVSEPLVASCNTLFCGAKFTSIEAHDLHVHKVHQHLCKLCSKVFATVDLLVAHKDSMHHFFCTSPGCGAYLKTSEELRLHIRKSHHHRCDICETIFPEIQGLLDHKDSVHKYRCDHDGCGASFTSLGKRVFHSETHRRACDKCQDTFPSIESLIEHRDKAHLFRCDHEGCSALFYNPESRNIHLRINHRHKCDKCKSFFSTVQGLLEHRDLTHLFSCEASGCDTRFSTQSALESHLTVHQHMCPNCTKVFSTAVDLSKHIASTHRFRCNEEDCEAWFDRVGGLRKHIELHEKVSNKATLESRATQSEDLFVSMESRDTQTEDLFYDTEENETGSSAGSEPDLKSDASELSTSPPTSATTPTYIYFNSAPNPFFKKPAALGNASHRSKTPSGTGEQDIDSTTPRSSLHYTPADAEDFMDKLVEDLEKFSLSSRN